MRVGWHARVHAGLASRASSTPRWCCAPTIGGKQGKAAFVEYFSWFAAPGVEPLAGQPLPLATQGESCRIRIEAVRALDRAGIEWREVFVGKGAAILGAAAVAGLAVAVLARRAAPPGTVDVSGLPVAAADTFAGRDALQQPQRPPNARCVARPHAGIPVKEPEHRFEGESLSAPGR